MGSGEIAEYRLQHLRERLAGGEIAELGVRVEPRGARVLVRGSVTSAECRAAVLRVVGQELAGIDWSDDLVVVPSGPPERPEDLS